MKNDAPARPAPWKEPRYWRSLDELARTPPFQEWLQGEFPDGAQALEHPVSRRRFLEIMSASFLLAGLGLGGAGCRRPEEAILPFARIPEGYDHGVAEYYATAMPVRGSAIPLLVKTHEGRPVKIEGNPLHPQGRTGTDAFAQASILNLYDPDRLRRFTRQGQAVAPAAAIDFLASQAREWAERRGSGLAILEGRASSPSRERIERLLRRRYPEARWYIHEPIDLQIARASAAMALGQPLAPAYRMDLARRIVSFDADLLGTEEDAHRWIHQHARGRQLDDDGRDPARLYVLESLMTLTGANADHRLRLEPARIPAAAARLWWEVHRQAGWAADEESAALRALANSYADPNSWCAECARDLVESRGQCLVVAGHRQPMAVHLAAWSLNHRLGNIGRTVHVRPAPAAAEKEGLPELAASLRAGQVEALVILDGNPAYTAPADLDWRSAQRMARTVIRLAASEDETSAACDWQIPALHFLESWGDARTGDGTVTSVQPLIQPLFGGASGKDGGWTDLEFLARIGGLEEQRPREIVRQTIRELAGSGDAVRQWRQYLHDGFLAGSAPAPASPAWQPGAALECWHSAAGSLAAQAASPGLQVVFHRDYSVDDGRYINNGWLQEMPDPITKLTWENAILISPRTARLHKLAHFDRIEIALRGRTVEGPVWIQPGMADNTLGLALGYGRERTGRVGAGSGYNAYRLRTAAALHADTGAQIRLVRRPGKKDRIACTQDHGALEGRPIVREASLDQFRADPGLASGAMRIEAHRPPAASLYSHPPLTGLHQWGMAVDLNACVGCSACVLACQSENNVPIVGRGQVARGREMHWLRIDRYYAGPPDRPLDEQGDDPQVVFQPMMCQQCEHAPCEYVCPVNATVHDEEGLNVMAYNRCVGTRYCANNCPYKVRRFNFFDYHRRPLDRLYRGPLAPKAPDERDLIQWARNPDVTVRMRGVMEKCTYCVQRIQQAKIARKIAAGISGDIRVPDGAIVPACAEACPAEAIVFGDLSDPNSRVSVLRRQARCYRALEFLDVRPRTSYLARIRNPNSRMPDWHEHPWSLEDALRRREGGRPGQAEPAGRPEGGG
ncbi:MAG TPA: TAT-variant-translocated molybdopterin oxidoreductase [Candidatus Paceibacterota bacterium]|nr:TAT-variant-translocated molybdopterin oxidoreductase [Verrucomicrobiota bacterium]HRZ46139.1 TAT-variant-translocated molybdopterin oxidoreductase [Candidatus Paceibacterota bacterium]HRZ93323.1 TAT-variant-translocated molybdopterin oxidoreductase [Candidatus Paceibacterota bacterium]